MKEKEPDFYCEQVISGKTKVEMVYESDNVLAFHHVRPRYQSHIVVIPRKHVRDLAQLEDEVVLVEMLRVIQDIARDTLKEHGTCRILTNLGEFQNNRHLHWHVVSRPLENS